MGKNKPTDLKIGEFLIKNNLVTGKQLEDALALQKDNPGRVVGEILVTQGALSKEDLVMAMEMYLVVTGNPPRHVDEWLDQDEVDMLMDRLKSRPGDKG
jgi:hypothetical protein